jgi:hypothetical protein
VAAPAGRATARRATVARPIVAARRHRMKTRSSAVGVRRRTPVRAALA